MHLHRSIDVLTKQLLAWSAITMLLLQPVGWQGTACGCGTGNEQATSTAGLGTGQATTKSCCSSAGTSHGDASNEIFDSRCNCGNQCCCSENEQETPLPALPLKESHLEQPLTLALMAGVEPIAATRTASKFGFLTFTVNRTALTALETCVLLSRFIV